MPGCFAASATSDSHRNQPDSAPETDSFHPPDRSCCDDDGVGDGRRLPWLRRSLASEAWAVSQTIVVRGETRLMIDTSVDSEAETLGGLRRREG